MAIFILFCILISMNVNSFDRQTFTAKLVPLKEYKGPILKLTKKDKAEIDELLKKRAMLDLELSKLKDYVARTPAQTEAMAHFQDRAWYDVEKAIEIVDEMIKTIKTNRMKKQIAKQNKLDTKV